MALAHYMSRETLAAALDLKPGAIDGYVKRGLLPQPIKIGDAVRWRWADVDDLLRNAVRHDVLVTEGDPYLEGVRRVATPPTDS